MRAPVTKVFRRAGCGKPARPVRRGDGEPRIFIRYSSSYSTGSSCFSLDHDVASLATRSTQISLTQRKLILVVLLSGVLEVRAATLYRLQ